MFKPKLFFNKEIEKSLPGAVLPIVDENNGTVEAMLIIKEIPFESYNAFTEYILGLRQN